MSTVIGQEFLFQSGTGSDAWTFAVVVDASSNYFVEIRSSPLGDVGSDQLQIPASVIDDMEDAIQQVQSGSISPTGSTGSSG